MLAPLITPQDSLSGALRSQGHAVLDARGLCALTSNALPDLDRLRPSWEHLPLDEYLRDGGRYRRRRHSCFVVEHGRATLVPHRAHWQPVEYNALHGGLARWFEPVETSIASSAAWLRVLTGLAIPFSALKGEQPWFVEAHPFRIETTDGIGRPTPEGAHRDGVGFVAVILIDRSGIKGGETRVFDADGPHGVRFTMTEPWTTLVLDDERVIHESTPIQPLEPGGHRDTLVLTYRANGFQDAPAIEA